MKKIIFEKYKNGNVSLLFIFVISALFMEVNYDNWFKGSEPFDFYEYYYGIYSPVLTVVTWLSGILVALLFLPSQIFRKWLCYIAPMFLLLTYVLVQGISVYSTNLLNPTRAKMAENCMIALSAATVLFVLVQLVTAWRKKKAK